MNQRGGTSPGGIRDDAAEYIFERNTREFCMRETRDGGGTHRRRRLVGDHFENGTSGDYHPTPITRLCIFDFDSTLFRSPLPNPRLWAPEVLGTLISDCGWFSEPRTLQEPFIPTRPDESWFDKEVLREIREKMEAIRERGDTLLVLLTGRRHDLFGERIAEICKALDEQNPLSFDLLICREGHDPSTPLYLPTTLDFKLAVINHMLASFPLLNHIGLWDDRKRHLDLFERELLSLQKRGRITTYAVNHIIQDPCLEKYMPRETEKDLVDDLVQRCNSRIIAARERERRRETEIKLLVAQPKIVESPRPKDAEEKYNSNSASSLAGLMRSSSGTALAFEGTTSGTETITTSISKLSLSLPDLSTNGHATAVSAKRDPFPNSAMPLKQRRSSASLFRSIIELTESVFLTGIYLDAPSRARLLAAVPPPARWSVRAEHVTVSQGVAEEELIKPLGGLGATVAVRVVGTAVSKGVLAVKVEHKPSGPEEAPVRLSANATAHITVAVAVGSHSREVNNITEWTPLESAEELILTGVLTENKLIGLKGKMGVTSLAQQPKKEVSLGALVQKHHPTLMGKEIGKAVAVVQAWMEKTFMENLSQNLAHIELFVTNLQIRNGTVVVDQ